MYRSTRIYLTLLSLLFAPGSWADADCYFPDHNIAEHYQACDPGQSDGSACCDISNFSVCLKGGYCFGDDRFIYRGGCTDSNWTSPHCAKECTKIAPATYSTIFPCLSGVYTKEFCCSDTGGKSCCDANANAIFSFDPGKPYALLSTLVSDVQDNTSTSKLSTSSSSSGLSSTSTSPGTQIVWSTTTSTNPAVCNTSAPLPIPSSRNFTAIVLGVGVPPSLLLLLSLGFFFYRERHLRTMMESLKRKTKAAMRPHGLYPLVPNTGDLPHLEYTYRAPVELDSRSRWVYGAATRFELETGSLETGSNHS